MSGFILADGAKRMLDSAPVNKIDQVRLLSRRLDELETQIAALQQEYGSVKTQLATLLREPSPAKPAEEEAPEDADVEDQDLDHDPDKSSKADLVLEMLRKDPHLDYRAAAEAIYGESDDRTYRRVAALLTFLRKQGRIVNIGRARWKLVGEEPAPSSRPGKKTSAKGKAT